MRDISINSLFAWAACALAVAGCSGGGGGGDAPQVAGAVGGAPGGPPPGGPPPPPGGDIDADLRARLAAAGVATPALRPREPDALIELGRNLFFDKVLSGNRNISCATCHHPTAGTGDDLPLPLGEGASGLGAARTGTVSQVIPRNAPPLFHVGAVGTDRLFWDGRVSRDAVGALRTPAPALNGPTPARPDMTAQLTTALAAQAMFPVTSPEEMRGDPGDNELADAADELAVWDAIMARLVGINDGTTGGIEAYRQLFAAAYPGLGTFDELTFAHAARAIAAYEAASFSFFDTPLDRFLAGDDGALSLEAKRGGILFSGRARCSRCHGGPLLSDMRFHAIGAPQLGPGKGGEPDDRGLALETGDPRDDYRFRTPPLRNVSETGPWMHAGSFTTLGAVIGHYRSPANGLLSYDASQLPAFYRDLVDTDPTRNQSRIAAISPILGAAGVRLNPGESADLLAFLRALTDPAATTAVAVPASVPSGLPVGD
jgi:cytochrome c peroxidase